MKAWFKVLVVGSALALSATVQAAERLKDIAHIQGVRENALVGYGLVVGLEGTGDKTKFTAESARNLLANFGVAMPEGVDPKSKNIAAVALSAQLPAFAKSGQKMDVTVSSLGDAKSLRGGTLLMSTLRGADGEVYAVAQGNLVVSGFGVEGRDGSRTTVNQLSVGRVPGGATVERAAPDAFMDKDVLTFNLHTPDFTTAKRVASAINSMLGKGTAQALDAASIEVLAPVDRQGRVSYLSVLENIEVTSAASAAKVIVNARTGTVVMSERVSIDPVAITHGGLTVEIQESATTQLAVTPEGTVAAQIAPRSELEIDEESGRMFAFDTGADLQDVVDAVNAAGIAPGDLVAILEALKQAGALKAELVVI